PSCASRDPDDALLEPDVEAPAVKPEDACGNVELGFVLDLGLGDRLIAAIARVIAAQASPRLRGAVTGQPAVGQLGTNDSDEATAALLNHRAVPNVGPDCEMFRHVRPRVDRTDGSWDASVSSRALGRKQGSRLVGRLRTAGTFARVRGR